MPTPANTEKDLNRAKEALCALARRAAVTKKPPRTPKIRTVLGVREALFAPTEHIPTEESVGRIFASLSFSCPPAVPVLVAGEEITEEAIRALLYYGIETVTVVKK